MSPDPPRRTGRGSAPVEELLREARISGEAQREALTAFFAAATAPARESELSGEQSALSVFREHFALRAAGAAGPEAVPADTEKAEPEPATVVRLDREPKPRRAPFFLRTRVLRFATLGLAIATTGGAAAFAVAASTGHLPSALGGESGRRAESAISAPPVPVPSAKGSPGPVSSVPETGSATGRPDTLDEYRVEESGSPREPAPSASAKFRTPGAGGGEASLRGLCHKYLRSEKLNRKQRGKLRIAAGNRKRIRDFCVRIVERKPGKGPVTTGSDGADDGASDDGDRGDRDRDRSGAGKDKQNRKDRGGKAARGKERTDRTRGSKEHRRKGEHNEAAGSGPAVSGEAYARSAGAPLI